MLHRTRTLGLLVLWGSMCTGGLGCEGAPSELVGGAAEPGERQTGRFLIDGEVLELSVENVRGHLIFEGDIILDAEQITEDEPREDPGVAVEPLFAVRSRSDLWPGAVIPYVIADSVSTPGRVREAFGIWEETGVRFVRRTDERAYVVIREPDGQDVCEAQVGHDGTERWVHLRDHEHFHTCDLGAIVHELGHTLGLWHEHTRPDRNDHVRIVWSAISDRYRDAYAIRTTGVRLVGEYDLNSTMHYNSTTLSIGDRAAIVDLEGNAFWHDWSTLSRGDVRAIRELYFDGTPVPRDAGAPRDAGSPDEPDADERLDAGRSGTDAGAPERPDAPVAMTTPDAGAAGTDAPTAAEPGRSAGGCSAAPGRGAPLSWALLALAILAGRRAPRSF